MMKIRTITDGDITALKNLWYECFIANESIDDTDYLANDSKDSIDYYLTHYLDMNNTFVLTVNNEVKSSLVLAQHELYFNGSYEKVSFVSWVATQPQARGLGYMRALMEHAITYAKVNLKQNFLIIQAYDWDLYKRFGFVEAYYKSKNNINLDDLLSNEIVALQPNDSANLLAIYENYTKELTGYVLRNTAYYDKLVPYLALDGTMLASTNEAYCFYNVAGDVLMINECAFINKMSLLNLIRTIIADREINYIEVLSDTYNFKTNNKELVMMIKSLTKNKFISAERNYISENI